MAQLIALKIPVINANEDQVLLAGLDVTEGQKVEIGTHLAVIETTKSSAEIVAEQDGFIVGIMFKAGDTLKVGQVWAYIADTPQGRDETLTPWAKSSDSKKGSTPDQLRITEPALALARQYRVDLEKLPTDRLITTSHIQDLLSEQQALSPKLPWVQKYADLNGRMLVYGAGGHGRSLVEMIRLLPGYQVEGFVDDGINKHEELLGLPVLGGRDALQRFFDDGIHLAVNGVGGISNPTLRLEIFEFLNRIGYFCPRLIHPSAFLETTAKLAEAVQVFPLAYIGSLVKIGFGCIINTSVIISHDCILDELVNLSPGATLAGGVQVGSGSLVGMRATINLNVKVGCGARIGNGATVKADVPDHGIVPAGTTWPLRS